MGNTDLLLQCTNDTWKDSFNRLQRSKLLSVHNARFRMVAVVNKLISLHLNHVSDIKSPTGDMIELQGQEKVFLPQSMDGSTDVNKQYTKLTFTPTQADRFALTFRNWLRRHGNSQAEWFGHVNTQSLPSTYLSKRQIFDK